MEKSLPKKNEDFSEWYTEVVQKADLADYSAVKGCMIIKPNAYAIWETIQDYMNKEIKKLGVKNAYFPLFIPESFFKKEAEHAKGFKPEVAWLQNKDEGEDRLAIRPTSETVIYDAYAKWIRSYQDLPFRLNQWANIVRWETKQTRLFLRTREFLWQEGHCVYETKEECDKETRQYLQIYQRLCEDILAIPILIGEKTESEKFAGALYTTSIEGLMPDGKGLQMGTSHNLGQGFAKAFDITFSGKDEKKHFPWQNSWGVSTRLLGALIMTHGDDKGMIIPPRVASSKVVIIPIAQEKSKEVLKQAKLIAKKLELNNPILDERTDKSPGWKFNEWEVQGIPLRIELGPKDLEKNQAVLVRRDTGKKESVLLNEIKQKVEEMLEEIQKNLFEKAKKQVESQIVKVNTKKELLKALEEKKLAEVPWCKESICEEELKELTGAKSLNIPFEQPKNLGTCINCKKDAKVMMRFTKSY